ncbi:MAG: hypothetical protein A2568_03440 [Candidatus Yanofskybacteria bacterium RIFOXYD1_FULL_44_17]|nr:MAG: Cell wall surface anchor family protein [Candidatus Yanofskybacteria bacterium GW2011_GWE1_40_10]OGN36003.1 MAG: hypothetical protein A2207_03020 [Candidatus Yanofskybacteria bacterium RIFOXYA1_FULL_44_17]OGN36395.1 MAG: hypothetical protein A2241_01465 [Candidatus Yanofskybacteria bacterium RIFOXYA2_FULL_45_28]OGN37426.1 MAG: hypothetical protein A2371_00470 [Candidatus Yanofskybacteria bacterium RIFOXYB1_FULL_44_29]OGN37553.1 MAG: hypothetical protein A2302_03645 [Candidatus Yanofskyb
MSNLSKRALRVVATLTAITTILSLSGFAVLAPVANAAMPSDYGLTEGNTISAAGSSDPDIYIVNEQGYKRLFLNPVIFSFYGHLGGFANVKNVSAVARDAFPTSGLFRLDGDQKVYGLQSTGEDTAVLHWVNTTGAQAVADDPNFFKKVFVINQNEFNWYQKGSDYTSVNQIPVYTRGGSVQPGTNLSVGLASDNPAAGTLVKGQAAADLAHFTFTGSGTVTSLKLNRIGVSADTDLTNVYLYDGAKRLTDAASVASGVISFNDSVGIFTVSGSKTISVRADLDATSTGNTVGVQLVQFNGMNASVSGNLFTPANATLGTVSLATSNGVSTNTSLSPASDINVWQNTVTVNTRAANLMSVQFRVIGSINSGDVQNFRLYVDGVQKGSAVSLPDSNGYVLFDLTGAPVRLETGGRVVKVMADVINGSGRNFYLSVRQAPDFFTVDTQYGQPILTQVNSTTFTASSAGTQTIAAGVLTFTKATDSATGDVVKGASGVSLAKFEVKATGEKMKVESMKYSFTSSNGGSTAASNVGQLRNGAIFLDGVQIGSTKSLNEDSWSTVFTEYTFGSSFIVTPGTPKMLEVRADVYDADGTDNTAANDTIVANIVATTGTVQRMTSLDYTDITAKTGNSVTVKTGSFSAGKYSGYANQSVVAPKNNFKMGHFTLAAASSEDLSVNTINLDSDNSGSTMKASNLSDTYLKVYNDAGTLVYTSPVKTTLSDTASNSYSVNFTMPKNKTYQVEVWSNLTSTVAAGYMNFEMDAVGITTGSSTTSTATGVNGQTVTYAAGSLTKANGSIAGSRLAKGGDTVNAYSFTLQPAYDDYTLDEVYVDLSSTAASSSGAIANLLLKDGNGVLLSSATVNPTTGSASFVGVNKVLAQTDGKQTFTVSVQLADVGISRNDTGGLVIVRLDGLKYRNSSGTITTANGYATATYTGNSIISHTAYPVFANQALSSSSLATGAKDIFQTKVTSSGSQAVYLDRLVFTIAKSVNVQIGGGSSALSADYRLFEDGVDISSLTSIASASADLDLVAVGTGQVAFTFTNERPIDSIGHVYRLQVDVTAVPVAPASIVTSIANPSSSAITDDAVVVRSTLSSTSPSVVWSDSSAVTHSTSTDDWMNDYLIQTIGTSQSLSI